MDIERQDPWPWYGKLSEGDKVKVCSHSIYANKNSVNGHICIIKKIGSFYDSLGKNYKYILDWKQEDNPGRSWPEAIEDYFYMDNDILPVSIDYPILNTVKLADLPEI